ncbi:MAG: hypothetical protein ABI626_04470 [Sphingomicrobium sp.]
MASPEGPKPIVVNVGVTGHRAGALTAPLVRTLRPVVYSVLRQLRAAVLRIQLAEPMFCSATEARLLLHTGLASGADQIAALCARSSGYGVRALLPFEPSIYSDDFARGEELESFERALAAADEIVALAGHRSDLEGAYVLVGQSLVQTADVLVAIWDGERGRGLGGTAHVVELALQGSVPVLHIDIDRGSDRVRMRALIDGEETRPFGRSVSDPDLYRRLLQGALKLDLAPAGTGTGVPGEAAPNGKRA